MGRCFSKVKSSHNFIETGSSNGDFFHWTSVLSNIISDTSDSENDEYICSAKNSQDSDDNLSFLDDDDCVAVVCDEKSYSINTKALCKSSSYFKAMFSCSMKESLTKRVELKEIDPRIIELVLNYVDSSKFPEIEDKDVLLSMLAVSHMYLFNDLYHHCCNLIKDVIATDSYQQFLDLSRLHENEHFLESVVYYLADEFLVLKETLVWILNFEETCWVVKRVFDKEKVPVSEIESFIIDWIKVDVHEREKFSIFLLYLCDLAPLEHRDLNMMLEEVDSRSRTIFNIIVEKHSFDHIKIFLMNRYYNIWFYSLRSGKWLRLKDNFPIRTKIEKICGSVDDYIYVFKYEFLPKVRDILHTYKWNVYTEEVEVLPVLEIDRYILCDFYSAINDNDVFIVYKTLAQNMPCTKLYGYSSRTNEWKTLQMKHKYSSIESLVAVQNNLYIYGRDISNNRTLIQRYNILSEQWHTVRSLPSHHTDEVETPTYYLNDFYVIRHSQVVEKFIWKIGSPKPVRLINKQREAKHHIKYTDRCTETLCEVLSKKMKLFKYNFQNDTWKETQVTETPNSIACILTGPWSPVIRNPYIYVIGNDFHLYQYDPKILEWKNLYEFPRSVTLSNYYSVITPAMGF